ncbi:MAG: hypothetical protein F4Y45_03945 [Acidobacteria bacterium]|nr:hypothetical protein [Acidobacteriota bacterium]MXZ69899.1 hypothetical protein [Acidobacteriota bacterium]MYD69132.1 hypothetical protein [Acidobacteriota bacterium]MYJ04340.1 hypothetical protein [Acidobacteriota bacterium]
MHNETFESGTPDRDWLPDVGARRWILITKDKHIRKRELELRALRQERVKTFVLTGATLSGQDQARVLKEALPDMLRLLGRRAEAFIARVTAASDVQVIEWHKYVHDHKS